jgi:hypothetical protein
MAVLISLGYVILQQYLDLEVDKHVNTHENMWLYHADSEN